MLAALFLDLQNKQEEQHFLTMLSPSFSKRNVHIHTIKPDNIPPSISKQDCLLICDSPKGLLFYEQQDFYCVGYSPTMEFLPVSYCFENIGSITYTYFSNILSRYKKEPIHILDTSRLRIRELCEKDLPSLYRIYQQPGILTFMNDVWGNYSSFQEKWCAYINRIYTFYDYGIWGVFLKGTNTLIGQCGIQSVMIDDKEEIELGYLLSQPYQKNGYGKEMVTAVLQYAKTQLSFNRIVAQIAPENKASITLAQKCGMTFQRKLVSKKQHKTLFLFYI